MISRNEYEINASELEVKEIEDLSRVRDLNDAIRGFGYDPNDRLTRRELVVIFTKCRKDMTRLMDYFAFHNRYDAAKTLRLRLDQLKIDFENRQKSLIEYETKKQQENFQIAKDKLVHKLKEDHEKKLTQVNDLCDFKTFDLNKTYDIKTENLEDYIARVKIPTVKYSSRMISLLQAEHHLQKLNQYDEAKDVHGMIVKLRPGEVKRFYDDFDHKIDKLRENLRKQEDADRWKLNEKVKTIQWNDIRQRELEKKISRQRFEHHSNDMTHIHQHQLRLKPETSLEPSMLWQKRQVNLLISCYY